MSSLAIGHPPGSQMYLRRVEVQRPQTLAGSVSQMCAGLTHRVSSERLAKIADAVPYILIITGDDDNLIHPSKSDYLAKHMRGAKFVKWSGTGHPLHLQWPARFNALLEEVFEEAKAKISGS